MILILRIRHCNCESKHLANVLQRTNPNSNPAFLAEAASAKQEIPLFHRHNYCIISLGYTTKWNNRMLKRILPVFIIILLIIRIGIAVNTYSDGILQQRVHTSSINEETKSNSLFGEPESLTTVVIGPIKTSPKGYLYAVISAMITALLFICIVLACFSGLKMIVKQWSNNHSTHFKGVTYRSGNSGKGIHSSNFISAESKEPITRYIPSIHKKCPSCGEQNIHRIPRKWYMRLIPGSKRYLCRICRSKFTIFLWKITICG